MGSRVGQIGDGVVWASSPTPYKSKKNRSVDCGVFDTTLLSKYNSMFPNKPSANPQYRLSRSDAERFLDAMRKKHKDNVDLFYPETTKEILNIADTYGWEHYKKINNFGLGNLTNPDKRYDGEY